VLILLFADKVGDLRVVLTIRSAGLKNCTKTTVHSLDKQQHPYLSHPLSNTPPDAGQAALPGGKADTLHETPWQTARREAFEEIGLPMSEKNLPPGYTVEHLAELPANLAMTELGVRPCVAYLKTPAPSPSNTNPDAARDILPKLDAKEVAALFTAPFHNFLREKDEDVAQREVEGEWYKGSWHSWHESAWRMHNFSVPVNSSTAFLAKASEEPPQQKDASSVETEKPSSAPESNKRAEPGKGSSLQPALPRSFYRVTEDALSKPRFRVYGMTARILVDAARVAYGEEPEFEHNSHFGDEEMILRLLKIGRLNVEKKEGEILTKEVMALAKKAKMSLL
jgi:8-oxo-dGTP pyrophosphatase MutT (NUDIX family)